MFIRIYPASCLAHGRIRPKKNETSSSLGSLMIFSLTFSVSVCHLIEPLIWHHLNLSLSGGAVQQLRQIFLPLWVFRLCFSTVEAHVFKVWILSRDLEKCRSCHHLALYLGVKNFSCCVIEGLLGYLGQSVPDYSHTGEKKSLKKNISYTTN